MADRTAATDVDGVDADPRAEYLRRRDARSSEVHRLDVRHRRLADARLGVFALGIVLAVAGFGFGWLSPWWLVLPVVGFAALVVAYDAVGRRRARAGRREGFYQAGLDRIEGRWAGKGDDGSRFLRPDHPFDADLDLFGVGSLFERLCTARTGAGRATLAHWLLEPAEPREVRGRQEAVEELRAQLDLREEIALLGTDVEQGLHPGPLIAWGEGPPALQPPAIRGAARVLGALNVAALFAWAVGFSPLMLMVGIVATLIFGRINGDRLARAIGAVDQRADDLRVLAALLERIEACPFRSPRLRSITAMMESDGAPPSRRIARLAMLVALLEFRRNQLLAPLAFLLVWPVHLGLAIEGWRQRSGGAIVRWLDAVGQFEGLCALASYAFEVPGDPFPEVVEDVVEPVFEAQALGHPLIDADACVRNDVALGGTDGPRVILVSGSNMSGKSTLLRSIGANAVLAMAGAPVRAESLRITPVKLGATLRVQDSLRAGRSRFFAEITRLRALVDLAASPPPLLFLLDEILHGTNSHDRRAGAEGVVKGLLDRGSIGLVTTHDLALAEIVDRLGHRASNVHFEDHLDDGEIRFDYVMRPGVVQKSNALALMRVIGLDV